MKSPAPWPRPPVSPRWWIWGASVPVLCLLAALLVPPWQATGGDIQQVARSPSPTGILEGAATWKGAAVPQPTPVQNTTDPEVCGRSHSLQDLLVSARNHGIKDVIVVLVDVPVDKIPPLVPGRLLLDNVQCRFSPHVSVLTVGSVIETTNSDPVLHTTHLYGAVEANLALPLRGMRVSRMAQQAGMIVVKCDVHGWMQAFVRVDGHPFHAVSDASGSFRIAGIPPGEYLLESWHEKLGSRRQAVRIQGGTTSTIAIEFPTMSAWSSR